MVQRHRVRSASIFAFGAALLLFPNAANAGNRTGTERLDECAAAYARAKDRQAAGQLKEARDLLLGCISPACEIGLQQQCTNLYTQLDSDIPSIVPVVTDGAGAPLVDVQVTMDGTVLASHIGGQALLVDPGVHEFTFSANGVVFATQKLMILQGQRNRPILGSLLAMVPPEAAVATPSAADASTAASRGAEAPAGSTDGARPASPYAFVTGGLAGATTGALLILFRKGDESSVITDGFIGLSVGALIIATWLFAADRAKAGPGPPRTGFVVDVRPSLTSASVSLTRAF